MDVVYRFARIDFRDRTANVNHHSSGIAFGAQHDGHNSGHQRHEFFRNLHEGIIELRLDRRFRIGIEPPLLHVADHAHDLGLHVKGAEIDALPYGVFMREISARENVIYVHDDWRVLVVLGRNEAAAFERDSHGFLKTCFSEIKQCRVHIV